MSDITKKKAEALFNGAMNMFSSPSVKVSTAASHPDSDVKESTRVETMESNPEDIPKEDLLHLCMKLNKRMQSMETKGQELVKIKAVLLNERKQLIDAIKQKVVIPVNSLDNDEFDVASIVQLMKKSDDNQRDLIEALNQKISDLEQSKLLELLECENKYKKDISNLQRTVNSSSSTVVERAPNTASGLFPDEPIACAAEDAAKEENDYSLLEIEKLTTEIDALQATQISMVAKIKKLEIQNEEGKAAEGALQTTVALFEEKLHLRNEEITADKKKSEERRIKAEEKVMYLQLQLNNVKGREESANHDGIVIKKELEKMREMIQEREEVIAQRKELIEALQNKLFESENSTVLLRQKIAEVERNLSASQLLKDEKEGLLVALRRDVRALTEGKELAAKRMQELEDFKLKTETANNKILDMDTQLSALQASVEDKNTLLTRLRSELAVGERNLGLKTAGLIAAEALVSTRERETDAMRRELTTQTESLFQAMQKAKELEGKVESLETGLAEKLSQEEVKKSEAEFRESNIIKKYEDIITEMKLNTEDRLETIKRENFKKSSLARTLLTEREEENDFLRTKNEELVNEIQSGAPSDRRFFELAEIQAKREAVHGQHGSIREVAFQQLQTVLAKKDLELGTLQQNQSNLVAEISELRRHTKREGVNLDYLKNIVLQYMSFPLQSPEKVSLVPVIATLLQFNAKELEQVLKDPLWGNRPVKEVKRALSKASASTSGVQPHRGSSAAPASHMGAMEPLLGDVDGLRSIRDRDRDRHPAQPSNQISLESTLEFECEEEGVTVGGSR